MMVSPIYDLHVVAETRNYCHVRDRLSAEYPDLDDQTLADTLEGLTDLREMLAAVLRSALDDEAIAAGLSTRLDDMKARLERFQTRAKRKRHLVRDAMVSADLPKMTEADFTVSLRKSAASVEIAAENDIPAAYWKPQPPKLDRQGILAALKAGNQIPGAQLAAPQMQLSVRTK